VNATTTTETTVTEPVVGFCRTCKTEKPETAFPTISRPAYPGMRDWEECRDCKAAKREARKSPDYIHPDVQALIDAAQAKGFEVEVNPSSVTVFLAIRRVATGTESRTMLDVVNASDVMYLTFRRLSGGLVAGSRYSWASGERKVRNLRDAHGTLNVWAI